MTSKKVIIDCDPGTDDAHAIFMAVAHGNLDLVAITTVFGNVGVEQTTVNTLRVLEECGRPEIPVYKGCGVSLLGKGSPVTGYHGKDGLGEITNDDDTTVTKATVQEEHAVNTILKLAAENSGDLTLVAMGPLTNVAMALHLDPKLGQKLSHLVIMGGNTKARGNVTATAEFNFHCDPEAATFVLNHYGGHITLLDLELCQHYSPSWDFYDRLVNKDTKKSKFLGEIFKQTWKRLQSLDLPKFLSYDQAAIAVVISNKVVMETKTVYVTMELAGGTTRGQMVVDWNNKLGEKPNVELVTKLNMELFENMMIAAVTD